MGRGKEIHFFDKPIKLGLLPCVRRDVDTVLFCSA